MAAHKRPTHTETVGDSEDRLTRLVDIGGLMLPAYPDHPERRQARRDETADPQADKQQVSEWREQLPTNAFARARQERADTLEAYSRGWRPLSHVNPDDWPPEEVQADFYGALQRWLEPNLPNMTLEACASKPAHWPPYGYALRVPGGELWTSSDE